jgi:hypothetical protein
MKIPAKISSLLVYCAEKMVHSKGNTAPDTEYSARGVRLYILLDCFLMLNGKL